MEKLLSILQTIQDNSYIAIIGHKNPDADAICSARLLKYFIHQIHFDKKIQIDLFFDGEISNKMLRILDKQKINKNRNVKYSMAISVDSADIELLGKYKPLFESVEDSINIDHHSTNTNFGKYQCIREKSSTGSIIYSIMRAEKYEVSKEAASLVYASIVTDTNCFTNNILPSTYKTVEELMRKKIESQKILNFFFKSNGLAKTKLLSKALNSFKIYNNNYAFMNLKYIDFVRAKADFGDTLGIIDQAINITQIRVASIIIENEPKKFYVSLRSKGELDVSTVAQKFEGGGHKNMAGFTTECDYKTLKRNLVRACNQLVKSEQDVVGLEEISFKLPRYKK